MSNTPNRASNSAGKPRKKDVSLDLTTARQMLPLIQSIVTDIVNSRRVLNKLAPEQERLDRQLGKRHIHGGAEHGRRAQER